MVQRIGLIMDNSVSLVRLILEIWESGNSVVLIDWRIPAKSAISLLERSGVIVCYIDAKIFERYGYSAIVQDTHICITKVRAEEKTEFVPKEIMCLFHARYTNDEAVVFFSSGTTGPAKGICLSHQAINTNADSVIKYMNPQAHDRIYIVKSLAHSSTFVCELLVGLKSGMAVLLGPSVLSPNKVLKNISENDITILCTNPTLLKLYCHANKNTDFELKSLRTIFTSGAIASPLLIQTARSIFCNAEILNVYGLTEAGPRVTAQKYGEKNNNGSVGKAIDGVRVKVVDSNGEQLHAERIGRVYVQTHSLYTEYILKKEIHMMMDGAWLNTGDLGYWDFDGELHIVGRQDNMINVSGHNVYPEQIEDYIQRHTGVSECLVFGVPDEISGQRIICFYTNPRLENDMIRAECQKTMAAYEIPKEFIAVDAIPLTQNGKPSRILAQHIYAERNSR